ncbi:MAG: GntR family transcriptional regulator [Opitutaceae bacterium]|jgi:DNA-binding GntR family transcriptional regulator|nr:GntR family transcriptional regulator [Opitutaceae bacterium]
MPVPAKSPIARKSSDAESLSRQAYAYLSKKLLTDYAPGDILNRRQVAAELGMSVAPVLEAMVQLEADGLLETLPRQGTRVRAVHIEDLRGQLILREAIECQAARLYCGAPVIAARERLQKLAARIDRLSGATLAVWQAETAFHHALVQLAGCAPLIEAFDRVMRHKLFIALRFFLEAHPAAAPGGNHRKLVASLARNDPAAAEAALRAHLHAAKPAGLLPSR